MHLSDARVARELATGGWGKENKSLKDAAAEMSKNPGAMASASLEEIVLRLNQAIKAWSSDYDERDRPKLEPRPEYAKAFPGIKIGDSVYSCEELERGVHRDIVVSVDDEGYAMTFPADPCGYSKLGWASNEDFLTEREALEKEAKSDMKYHGKHYEYAKRIMAAIENGEDLRSFARGEEWQDDSDE